MKRSFRVTLEIPGDVTEEQMIEYIRAAVSNWASGGDPDDDLFYLDHNTVKVTRQNVHRHRPRKGLNGERLR